MKTLITFISLFFLSPFHIDTEVKDIEFLSSDSEIKLDKIDVIEYLKETKEALDESVEGLSDEQMQFKPDENTWSVAQVVEHIIIVEGTLKSMLEGLFEEGETPDQKAEVKMTDEEVVGLITNRKDKIQTQPQFQPSGKFTSAEDALDAFDEEREKTLDWLKDSDVNMRNYVSEFPFGKIDAYQTILFMAGHSARHTAQIEELKNHPEFPEE